MSTNGGEKHIERESAMWFISEPGHVETLAEVCRLGQTDDIDVDRIYWLGKTCRSLFISNSKLKEKLESERKFNLELHNAVKRFNDTLERTLGEVSEEVIIEASYLVEVIFNHTHEDLYKEKKPTIFKLIISKMIEYLTTFK